MSQTAAVRSSRFPSLAAIGQGFADVIADNKVRAGIKLCCASCLALFLALVLRLDKPQWALFTVIVLSLGQYVGAIAPRAVARVIGTILGGFVGIWLLGNYQQTTTVFLPLYFLIIAVWMYLYSGTIFPYAFFLATNAFTAVCGYGLSAPQSAWTVGRDRMLETLIGAIAMTITSNLVFPRYARAEFRQAMAKTVAGARDMLAQHARRILTGEQHSEAEQRRIGLQFRRQNQQVAALLAVGAKESAHLRARLPSYRRAVVSLNRILQSSFDLFETQPAQPHHVQQLGEELTAVYGMLGQNLEEVARVARNERGVPNSSEDLQSALEVFERRLAELRAQHATQYDDLDEVLQLGSHYRILHLLAEEIAALRAITSDLPVPGGAFSFEKQKTSFRIDPVRVRAALRPAVGSTLAIFLVDWLQPPGGQVAPLLVYVLLSITGPGGHGQGDRGALQGTVKVATVGLIYPLLMFLFTPLLSNYVIMNIFLCVLFMIFAYWVTGQPGQTVASTAAIVFMTGPVGLNPQVAVTSASIISSYLALAVPILFSGVVSRVFLPTLPESELRRLWTEFFRISARLVHEPPGEANEAEIHQVNFLPLESLKWVQGMRSRVCSSEEVEKLMCFSETMRALALHVTDRARQHLQTWPSEVRELLEPSVQEL
ncbi:MAG: FUSC family protein, partial [Verrucomicrobia bacterium]|nr:FUSC family protein [Verrucomicrobiota bacterium]